MLRALRVSASASARMRMRVRAEWHARTLCTGAATEGASEGASASASASASPSASSSSSASSASFVRLTNVPTTCLPEDLVHWVHTRLGPGTLAPDTHMDTHTDTMPPVTVTKHDFKVCLDQSFRPTAWFLTLPKDQGKEEGEEQEQEGNQANAPTHVHVTASEAAQRLDGHRLGLVNVRAQAVSDIHQNAESIVDDKYLGIIGAHADTTAEDIQAFLRGYNISSRGIEDLGCFGTLGRKKFLVRFMMEDETFQAARIKHRQTLLDQKLEVTLMFSTIANQPKGVQV